MSKDNRFGLYRRKDGYVFYCYWDTEEMKNRTIYVHREVMEKSLGRALKKGETVHHIDGNPGNNDIENLQLLSSNRDHSLLHGKEKTINALLHLRCVWCDNSFTRVGNDERGNRKKGKYGPFCSKSCSGKWSREQQIKNGQINLRST